VGGDVALWYATPDTFARGKISNVFAQNITRANFHDAFPILNLAACIPSTIAPNQLGSRATDVSVYFFSSL
jgi:hypothetical protein